MDASETNIINHKKAYLSAALRAFVMAQNEDFISGKKNDVQERLAIDIIKYVYSKDSAWVMSVLTEVEGKCNYIYQLKDELLK